MASQAKKEFMAKANALQKEMESGMNEVTRLQKDLAKCRANTAKFDTQLTENLVVQKELGLLEPEGRVFKLMGPVLVPQDLDESKMNVDKRIEYINTELARYRSNAAELERKKEAAETKCIRAQEKMQKLQAEVESKTS